MTQNYDELIQDLETKIKESKEEDIIVIDAYEQVEAQGGYQQLQKKSSNENNVNAKCQESSFKNQPLRGLVLTKGPQTKSQNGKDMFTIDIEDDEEVKIEVIFLNGACQKYYNFLQLDKTYLFSKFSICKNDKTNQSFSKIFMDNWSVLRETSQQKKKFQQPQQVEQILVEQNITRIKYSQQNRFEEVVVTPMFFPNLDFNRTFFNYFRMARKELLICIYSITSEDLFSELQQLNGGQVRILTDYSQTYGKDFLTQYKWLSEFQSLTNINAQVRIANKDFICHHKFIVMDERYIFTGSLNLSNSALKYNQYNDIIRIEDVDTAKQYKNRFEELWEISQKFQIINSPKQQIVATPQELNVPIPLSEGNNPKNDIIVIDIEEDNNKENLNKQNVPDNNKTNVLKMIHKKICKSPRKRKFSQSNSRSSVLGDQEESFDEQRMQEIIKDMDNKNRQLIKIKIIPKVNVNAQPTHIILD